MVQDGRQGGPLRRGWLCLNLLDERVRLRPSEEESRRNARAETRAGRAGKGAAGPSTADKAGAQGASWPRQRLESR